MQVSSVPFQFFFFFLLLALLFTIIIILFLLFFTEVRNNIRFQFESDIRYVWSMGLVIDYNHNYTVVRNNNINFLFLIIHKIDVFLLLLLPTVLLSLPFSLLSTSNMGKFLL